MDRGLKLCPFCGGDSSLSHYYSIPTGGVTQIIWKVQCRSCHARVEGASESNAAASWNKRQEISLFETLQSEEA